MERDKEAETFSEALFTYLWFTENLVCSRTAASTVGDMSDFIAEVAKAVVVLSALTVPSFNENKDTDQEAFMNFLKEINYLFPKLNISKPQSEYMVSIATNTELCEHHQMNISEPVNIPSTLNSSQNSEFIENSNQLVVSYNSGEENEESDEHSEMRLHPNSEVSSEESEDTSDSDEELCRELLKECLDVLKKYDDLPPVDWCVVCQNKRDLKAVDDNDNVCVKHNRGSFYYVVTHSETEDLDI
ncbi:uncharacterized protein CEXT_553061 [Caerostris extrusa]|uniref:Uncharacterized protein n=1 Tax=Caerostris extrusa TaxID=172846 RepID=A0AAV4XGL9_CAEEX|nr:uncharacterized protein CEXT_553061 [Caerostris extrusa]